MKFFTFLCFALITLDYSSPSWLSDIFSEFDESAEDPSRVKVGKLRRIFVKFEDSLRKNIAKWRDGNGENSNLLATALKNNKHLKGQFKAILKNIPDMQHENFIEKLNKFLSRISTQNLADKYEMSDMLKNVEKHNLTKSHMTKVEDSNEFKKHLKDAVNYVNSHILEGNSKGNEEKDEVAINHRTDSAKLGEKFVENYVSKHFQKPHHLSVDEEWQPKTEDLADKSGVVSGDRNEDLVDTQIEMKGVANVASDRIVTKENEDTQSDIVELSQLSDKQKIDYLKAERVWEKKLAEEAQRLLDKLKPADAYIIPDLPLVATSDSKNSKAADISLIDGSEVIKNYINDIIKRKEVMLTVNKKWKEYDEFGGGEEILNGDEDKTKARDAKLEKKLFGNFAKQLASEEHEWFEIKSKALAKLKAMEKKH